MCATVVCYLVHVKFSPLLLQYLLMHGSLIEREKREKREELSEPLAGIVMSAHLVILFFLSPTQVVLTQAVVTWQKVAISASVHMTWL